MGLMTTTWEGNSVSPKPRVSPPRKSKGKPRNKSTAEMNDGWGKDGRGAAETTDSRGSESKELWERPAEKEASKPLP